MRKRTMRIFLLQDGIRNITHIIYDKYSRHFSMGILSRSIFWDWNLFPSFINFKVLRVTNIETDSLFGDCLLFGLKKKAIEALQNADEALNKTQESLGKITLWFSESHGWLIILMSGLSLYLFVLGYSPAKRLFLDASYWIQRNVASSKIVASDAENNYISRPLLEGQLDEAFTSTPNGYYHIVYGHKGVGKTELVIHAAIKDKANKPRNGVLRVFVTSSQNLQDIFRSVLSKWNVQYFFLDIEELLNQLKKVYEREGIYPTIIFDVECGASTEDVSASLDAVRSLVKHLALACRCIIVLSEANAVLEMGKDPREKFIFVDELLRQEAVEYLKLRRCEISESDMNYVFNNIGTSPVILVELVDLVLKNQSIHDFVNGVLIRADQDLATFPLQTLLQALKDHPEGVSPKYFKKQHEWGVDLTSPPDVGKVMKLTYNPIVYRIELAKYQLLSTPHKVALQSYNPINPIPILN